MQLNSKYTTLTYRNQYLITTEQELQDFHQSNLVWVPLYLTGVTVTPVRYNGTQTRFDWWKTYIIPGNM